MTTVTQHIGGGDPAVEKPLLDIMFDKARTMSTEELRAEHAKGRELDWRATWYASTMYVLEHVLAERERHASSEVPA